MCGTTPESECSPKNFLFSNTEAWRLYSPENRNCKGVRIFYLVWRWVWTTVFLSTFIWSIVNTIKEREKWLIYLTNWAYTLYCAGQLTNAIVSTVRFVSKDDSDTIRWYMKLNWFLYEVSQVAAILITLMSWILLYDPTAITGIHTYFNHGVNGGFVLLDIWVTAMPIKVLHFYIPTLFGVIYAVFTIIYYFSNGTNGQGKPYIYSIFDWSENPTMPAISTVAAVVSALVLHFALFGLHKLRICIYSKCLSSSIMPVDGKKTQRYDSVELAQH